MADAVATIIGWSRVIRSESSCGGFTFGKLQANGKRCLGQCDKKQTSVEWHAFWFKINGPPFLFNFCRVVPLSMQQNGSDTAGQAESSAQYLLRGLPQASAPIRLSDLAKRGTGVGHSQEGTSDLVIENGGPVCDSYPVGLRVGSTIEGHSCRTRMAALKCWQLAFLFCVGTLRGTNNMFYASHFPLPPFATGTVHPGHHCTCLQGRQSQGMVEFGIWFVG